MGEQIEFLATVLDQHGLLDLADNLGCKAIPAIIPTDTLPKSVNPSAFTLPEKHSFFYLVPSDISSAEVFYEETKNDSTQSILMSHVSAVIQFAPSSQQDSKIFGGRIYINLDPADRFYKTVKQTYNQMSRYIRKWDLLKKSKMYVGPEALELAKKSEVVFFYLSVKIPFPEQ